MTGKLNTYPNVFPINTDLIGISRDPFDSGTYFNTTAEQLKTYISGNGSFSTVWVDERGGIDAPGNGSVNQPFKSIDYAESQITTAAAGNPFLILCNGHFVEANLNLKPYIGINGLGMSSLIVTGTVSIDASWSATGGQLFFGNFINVQFLSTTLLDFSLYPAATLKFSNLIMDSSPSFSIIGGNASNTNVLMSNISYFGNIPPITLLNCTNVYVENSTVDNLTVEIDPNFTLSTFAQINNVDANTKVAFIINSSATSIMNCYTNACTLSQYTISSSAATLTGYLTNTYCPQIEVVGTTSRLKADKLQNTPLFSSGATFPVNVELLPSYNVDPNMTTVQMLAIVNPPKGMKVFDTTTSQFMGWNGTAWIIRG